MRLKIHSHTRYDYEKVTSFSPHIVRLFPRQDASQRVLEIRFSTLETASVQHRRDLFDNQVARCFFPGKFQTLDFDVQVELELKERSAFDFILDGHAAKFPFTYTPRERQVLMPYLIQPPEEQVEPGDLWPFEPGQSTVDALLSLNSTLFASLTYERREEGEAHLPALTLETRTGSCRDFSRLAAALLRTQGVAVRLVSGYLCEFDKESDERRAEGALHAWIEAYIPGAGWLGMDPTNGILCDHHFISAAVGLHPEDISPVAGSYFGNEFIPSVMTATLTIEPLLP